MVGRAGNGDQGKGERVAMRARSTGLGNTELVLKAEDLKEKDGRLILQLRSIEPVNWRVRILIERKDIGRFFILALKGPLFLWLLSFFRRKKSLPIDY